jgi:hypothetical protein
LSTHSSTTDSFRINLAISHETRERLGRLAEIHHRTLSGEVAWLIDAAYRHEKEAVPAA